ncbi:MULTISPECIES: DUF2853 family protein [unclassified Novosphingobium]|uniref:DUF2853 family protein n=1 Tax=unclassified Novosphingobium TaxID=2644732 RepID=UPI0025EEA7CC|nr:MULTISPECIES: DUF2853 family protein [unclassified Novosphingobium]HQV02969.1 DUF2853 family protein [Novosphingobium sp.]
MATDWAADVKKYAAKADDAIIAGIVRYCGIALRNRDSALVSFSDPKELDRVRNNFLKKKLGRTETDSVLDAAIAKVGDLMKADRTKNRVTVYYLLADNFGALGLFEPKAKPTAAKAPAKTEKKPAAAKATAKAETKPAATKAPAKKSAAKAAGAAAAVAGAATAGAAAAKKPAAKKAAAPKAAPAKKAAAPAKVSTTKSAATKKSVNTGTAAAATAAAGGALGLASAAPAAAKQAAGKAADSVADTAKAVASAATDTAKAATTGAADAAKATVAAASDAGAAVAGAAGAAAAGAASLATGAASKAASAVSGGAQSLSGSAKDEDSGLGWLWWLLGLALLLFLAWWLFLRGPSDDGAAGADSTSAPVAAGSEAAAAPAGTAELAAAPAEGTVTIPTGAGVTTESREGKPVVKVYFDSGKIDVVPAFDPAAGGLKGWLEANPGSSLAISGYADPSGNAAMNADLAKKRAQAVQAALVKAGIPEASAVLVKPENVTDASVAKDAARRVEVVVK